jgi:hypothetical protein
MAEFSPLTTIRKMATGQAMQSGPAMLGRFELRRILGQGAQSVVWLAFDPRLEREVAIKLIKVGKDARRSSHCRLAPRGQKRQPADAPQHRDGV